MDELISQLSSQFGLAPTAAKGATGTVLSFLQQRAGPDVGSAIGGIPGAAQAMQEAPPPTAEPAGGGGGGLAGMLGAAGGLLGGAGGGGAGGAGALAALAPLLGGLSRSGINAQTAMSLVPVVLRFLEPHLGAGRFGQLLSSIPALQGLLGGAGAGAGSPGATGGLGDVMKKLF